MHDLAITLKKNGINISGSDDVIYDPSKSKLKKNGLLPKNLGYNKNNISKKIDLVITGMHTKKNNPELLQSKKLKLPILSYPEYISSISENKHRIVIAGSHGKTTITSMIMHVLKEGKINFDYVIGANAKGFKNNISISDAPIIIIEGDEYLSSPIDRIPKFLKYNHHIVLINGIEWDHYNVFKTENTYKKQFKKLIEITPKGGEIIYNENDETLKNLCLKFQNENIILRPYTIEKCEIRNKKTYIFNEKNNKIKLKIFGKHNMQNLAGAKIICNQLGVKDEEFYRSIISYELPHSRLQIINNSKTKIFKDFAHSPSKLKATINAVKENYTDKLLVCYELHSSSSFELSFLENYKDSLKNSDYSIIYISEKNLNKFSSKIDQNQMKKIFNEKNLQLISNPNSLEKLLKDLKYLNFNKLLMSSGNFDDLNFERIFK